MALRLRPATEGRMQKPGRWKVQVTSLEFQGREKPLLVCIIKGDMGNHQRRKKSLAIHLGLCKIDGMKRKRYIKTGQL